MAKISLWRIIVAFQIFAKMSQLRCVESDYLKWNTD